MQKPRVTTIRLATTSRCLEVTRTSSPFYKSLAAERSIQHSQRSTIPERHHRGRLVRTPRPRSTLRIANLHCRRCRSAESGIRKRASRTALEHSCDFFKDLEISSPETTVKVLLLSLGASPYILPWELIL